MTLAQAAQRPGERWERVAESFLHDQGLTTVRRNFRCRLGEIDLVMREGDCVVFVEVRYRRSRSFGSGADTVTRHKQRRIVLAARMYLGWHEGSRPPPCRFDVVSIGHCGEGPRIEWIRNAFDATAQGN